MFIVFSHLQLTILDWTSCWLSHEGVRRNTHSEMMFLHEGTTAGHATAPTEAAGWERVKHLLRCQKWYLDFFELEDEAAWEATMLLRHRCSVTHCCSTSDFATRKVKQQQTYVQLNLTLLILSSGEKHGGAKPRDTFKKRTPNREIAAPGRTVLLHSALAECVPVTFKGIRWC